MIAERIREAMMQAFRERPRIIGDEWCEANLHVGNYSPWPGQLSFALTPYLREPVRFATSEPGIRLMMIIAPVQGGKTVVFDCACLFHGFHHPAPMLVFSDTDDNANDYAENRLNVFMDESPCVKILLPPERTKNKRNSKRLLNGTQIWVKGARAKSNLQRRSARYVIGDEIWLWPHGHIAEAIARTTAFHGSARIIMGSQAGTEGQEMCDYWDGTDRREWCWTCPECGHEQPWSWDMAVWDDIRTPEGEPDYAALCKTARYRCKACNHEMPDDAMTRTRLNRASRYIADNPTAERGRVGFHFTALCFLPLAQLVAEYVKAKTDLKDGNDEPLRQFTMKRLAETWRDEMAIAAIDSPKTGALMEQPWPGMSWWTQQGLVDEKPPEGTQCFPLACLSVDVMKHYFYYVVRAWSRSGESMLIDAGRVNKWTQIEALREKYGIFCRYVFVDYGYDSDGVAYQCAQLGYTPVKGDGRRTWPHQVKGGRPILRPYSPPQKVTVPGGKFVNRVDFSADVMKDTIHFARIRTSNGRGPRFLLPDDIQEEYLQHLAAEKPKPQPDGTRKWEQIGSRANHLLDCESMQMLFAYWGGLPVAGDWRPE